MARLRVKCHAPPHFTEFFHKQLGGFEILFHFPPGKANYQILKPDSSTFQKRQRSGRLVEPISSRRNQHSSKTILPMLRQYATRPGMRLDEITLALAH
jgi:hypothetical protein